MSETNINPCKEPIKNLGNRLTTYAYKFGNTEVLQSYQLASLLMMFRGFGIDIGNELTHLRYDIASNHVIVTKISDSALAVLNLEQEDEDTFRFKDTTKSIQSRINGAISTLTWPANLRPLLHWCFEDDSAFSILNFVCGCHYWDSYAMYRMIVNRKAYRLSKDILTDSTISPTCYLPDVPDVFDKVETYLTLFRSICDSLSSFDMDPGYLRIEIPHIEGILTEEIWELSDKFAGCSDTGCYRIANKIRQGYLRLTDLSEGIRFVRNSFYDFGVVV